MIDKAYLATLTGDDLEFRSDLLGAYLESAPDLLEEIRVAVKSGDIAGASYAAHTLKGSSRSIGAIKTSEIAGRIEDSCREGSHMISGATLAELETSCKALFAEVEELRTAPASS